MFFEVWKSKGQWRWHLKAANGEKIASGEGYTEKRNCLHAVDLVKDSKAAKVREVIETS